MLNHITLMGRLVRDPELRHTQSDIAVTTFTLACERDYSGDKEKQTDFVDVVAWRGTAEFAAKYFTKGQLAAVSGRLQFRDWTDKDSNKRRSAEVLASNIYFAEKKRDSGNAADYRASGDRAVPASGNQDDNGSSQQFTELDDGDGELPF